MPSPNEKEGIFAMKKILPFLVLALLSCPKNPTIESPDPNSTTVSLQGARPVDFSFTAHSPNGGENMSLRMTTEIQTHVVDPLGPTPVLIPETDMVVGTLEILGIPEDRVKIFLDIDLTAIYSFETSMGRAKRIRYPDGSYLPESCRGRNRTGAVDLALLGQNHSRIYLVFDDDIKISGLGFALHIPTSRVTGSTEERTEQGDMCFTGYGGEGETRGLAVVGNFHEDHLRASEEFIDEHLYPLVYFYHGDDGDGVILQKEEREAGPVAPTQGEKVEEETEEVKEGIARGPREDTLTEMYVNYGKDYFVMKLSSDENGKITALHSDAHNKETGEFSKRSSFEVGSEFENASVGEDVEMGGKFGFNFLKLRVLEFNMEEGGLIMFLYRSNPLTSHYNEITLSLLRDGDGRWTLGDENRNPFDHLSVEVNRKMRILIVGLKNIRPIY